MDDWIIYLPFVLGKTDTDKSELRSWYLYVWVFRRNDDIYEPTMQHHEPRAYYSIQSEFCD